MGNGTTQQYDAELPRPRRSTRPGDAHARQAASNDKPTVVPACGWEYARRARTSSCCRPGTAFKPDDIYEFSYTAKDPTVNGIGMAAVRDFNAWLRYATKDDCRQRRTRSPATCARIYTEISSQPGRLLNDFRLLGFNQAENGKKVFDGMMQWVAAADGINLNYRFSRPEPHGAQPPGPLVCGRRVPVRQRARRPIRITGQTAGRYDAVRRDQHLPAGDGDLFVERVLGEGRVAVPHRHRRGRSDLPGHP